MNDPKTQRSALFGRLRSLRAQREAAASVASQADLDWQATRADPEDPNMEDYYDPESERRAMALLTSTNEAWTEADQRLQEFLKQHPELR